MDYWNMVRINSPLTLSRQRVMHYWKTCDMNYVPICPIHKGTASAVNVWQKGEP